MLKDLAELISIPSVYDASTVSESAPYGKNCKAALDYFINKCAEYGISTVNLDNRCAYAEIGAGSSCVAALCHLDVVPAGEGWTTPPFTLNIIGNTMYGRGVTDDKGAVINIIHALKEIKESGVKLKRRIRLIVGCDEERGSSCIEHYVAMKNEQPLYAFVPDANYPLVNCEKGILQAEYAFDLGVFSGEIISISGAQCPNAVPSDAKVTISSRGIIGAELKKLNQGTLTADIFNAPDILKEIVTDGHEPKQFSIIDNGDTFTVMAKGSASHASTPYNGDNALWKIFCFLSAVESLAGNTNVFVNINDKICSFLSQEKLGISYNDEQSGELTMSLDMARIQDNALVLTLDIRYPSVTNKDDIINRITKSALCTLNKIIQHKVPLFFPKDSKLITCLMGVYNQYFDDGRKPIIMGGGTYARELKNAVAFGPVPSDYVDNIHDIDECMEVDLFHKNKEVFKTALLKLCEL